MGYEYVDSYELYHGRLAGWIDPKHKYTSRKWKNGKWVYTYDRKKVGKAINKAWDKTKDKVTKAIRAPRDALSRAVSPSLNETYAARYGTKAQNTKYNIKSAIYNLVRRPSDLASPKNIKRSVITKAVDYLNDKYTGKKPKKWSRY